MRRRKSDFLKEFEGYLSIDKNNLDTVVSQQSNLRHKVGKELAKANGLAATKKKQLKEVDATLASIHRRKLEKLGRATESQVTNAVILDERHGKALDAYIKAVEHAEKLESLRDSFKDRNFMIRDMVTMVLSEYLSKESFDNSEEIKDYKQQRVNQRRKR